jgi:hypothetical protein
MASHSSAFVIDEAARNPVEFAFGFKGETRPLGGKSTTCAAGLAHGLGGFRCRRFRGVMAQWLKAALRGRASLSTDVSVMWVRQSS